MGRAREGRVHRTCLLLGVLLLPVGCSPAGSGEPQAGAAEGEVGNRAEGIPREELQARTVLSLVPAATALVVDLGAGDRLVGRVEEDLHPDVRSRPSVGSLAGPNTEAILRLNPDLILAPAGDLPIWAIGRVRPIQARLRPLALARVGEHSQAIRDLGSWLGAEERADSLARSLDRGLEEARLRARSLTATPVLWLVGRDPVLAVGRGTLQSDLLDLAGGQNVAEALGAGWAPVDGEMRFSTEPQVVLWSPHPLAPLLEADAAGRDLRSAAPDSLFGLRSDASVTVPGEVLEPSGLRILEAVRFLFQVLHPPSPAGPAEAPADPAILQ